MADTQQAAQPTQIPLSIQAQYLKDLSFEHPTAPGHFNDLQQAAQSFELWTGQSAPYGAMRRAVREAIA